MFPKQMFPKTLAAVLTVLLASAALQSQATPAAPSSPVGLELPVTMRQSVAAGATPVGTRLEAKLTVATLINGIVVPADAILSGEVIESVAKSATNPSRLAIRMDSAQWKNGSAAKVLQLPTKVYLTASYYPPVMPSSLDVASGMPDAGSRPTNWGTSGTYPGQRYPTAPPFPGTDDRSKDTGPAPPNPASNTPPHRTPMKNVDSTSTEGVITLTCKRSNIKLDKTITYVFGVGRPNNN
jgi:hypothetical protein